MKYEIETNGNWQRRVINGGWVQRREGTRGRWMFEIVSFDATFSGHSGFCHVENTKQPFNRVPIDAQDRILINGRRYRRAHWHH